MPTLSPLTLLLLLTCLISAPASAQVAPFPPPAHWYSFEGNLLDSVGAANGVPFGGAPAFVAMAPADRPW
jgi:hypothetical protein